MDLPISNGSIIKCCPDATATKSLPKIRPTPHERAFRMKKKKGVKIGVLKCAICDAAVQKIQCHPLFDTLICGKCLRFYTSGDFKYDANGEDLFCRMCADGGSLVLCTKCPHAICKNCLAKHSKKSFKRIRRNPKWRCFICDVSPLYGARLVCEEAKAKFLQEDQSVNSGPQEKVEVLQNNPVSESCIPQKFKIQKIRKNHLVYILCSLIVAMFALTTIHIKYFNLAF